MTAKSLRRCCLCFLVMPDDDTDGHGLGECVAICGKCLGAGCWRCLWSGVSWGQREGRRAVRRQIKSAVWMAAEDWRWILFREVKK